MKETNLNFIFLKSLLIVMLLLCVISFLIGTTFGSINKNYKKCETRKRHNILETFVVPLYFSERLGCELVEHRFN